MAKVSDNDLDRMANEDWDDKTRPFCPNGCGCRMKFDRENGEWYCPNCEGVDYGGYS